MTISEKDFLMLCETVYQGLREQSRIQESSELSTDQISLSSELIPTIAAQDCPETSGQNKTDQEETQTGSTGRTMAYLHHKIHTDPSAE